MEQLIILGSEGFIGNHLVNYFLEKGYRVYGCDLFERPRKENYHYIKVSRLSPEWAEIFSKTGFDCCINASGSGNVPYSMTHPLIDFESNTLDVMRILEGIRHFNPSCRYLHISSAAVYGNPVSLPVNELANRNPLSPYGWHKLMAEHVCVEYYTLFKVRSAILRPFSVYGQGLRKQLLWDICTKLAEVDHTQLSGTGSESRDFIHVSDLVQLIDQVVHRSEFCCDVYNAASGTETTIRQVADIFENYYKGKKNISFSGITRSGDPLNWKADIQKAQNLGFSHTVSLKDGIYNYIEWYNAATK